jgi:hypothetical protein
MVWNWQVMWLCETKLVVSFSEKLVKWRAQALGQYVAANFLAKAQLGEAGERVPCMPVLLTTFQHKQGIVFCQGSGQITPGKFDERIEEHTFSDVYAALALLRVAADKRRQLLMQPQRDDMEDSGDIDGNSDGNATRTGMGASGSGSAQANAARLGTVPSHAGAGAEDATTGDDSAAVPGAANTGRLALLAWLVCKKLDSLCKRPLPRPQFFSARI